mmetsp:Transcript_59104/g.163556  ORF Transcript_59104/g.163556 Transcript_59104/m.163556 type:complete len:341 (+) Transcript_59104:145-1167(+)
MSSILHLCANAPPTSCGEGRGAGDCVACPGMQLRPAIGPALAARLRPRPRLVATAPVNKPKHKGKAVLAGGLSGAIEICITYPIEYVKTRQQLATSNMSIADVVRGTKKPFGFYRGLDSMFYFALPKAAARFGFFELFSGLLTDADGGDKYGLGGAKGFVAGLGAGAAEAVLVTTPQETLKIKLIHDAFLSKTPRFRNFFHGVAVISREEGIAQCYKGIAPTVFKVATAQATRFGVFNVIPAEHRSTPVKSAAAGAFAGAVSVLLFQGVDVVKSRMQGLESHKYSGTLDCVRTVLRDEGVGGFYKGVVPRLTRVMCEVAITMTLYGEIVKVLNTVWHTEE